MANCHIRSFIEPKISLVESCRLGYLDFFQLCGLPVPLMATSNYSGISGDFPRGAYLHVRVNLLGTIAAKHRGKDRMKQLGRIIAFTKRLTPYYIMIVVASVFVTAANIVVPFIIGRATDTAVSAATGTTSSSAAITTVLWLAGAFFLVDVLSTITSSIGGYYGDVMSQKMRAILSVRYYEKLLTLPQSYFDSELTGTITSRLNRSIAEVINFAKSFANSFFTTLMTVALNLVLAPLFIFVFNWGIRGAALSTVLAQMFGALFVFNHFTKRSGTIYFLPGYFHCLIICRSIHKFYR